jgi:hypothetical protein
MNLVAKILAQYQQSNKLMHKDSYLPLFIENQNIMNKLDLSQKCFHEN